MFFLYFQPQCVLCYAVCSIEFMYNLTSFISGDADIVRCFCCDFGVAEMNHTDDVWVERTRHSSTCWFLKTQKGEEL